MLSLKLVVIPPCLKFFDGAGSRATLMGFAVPPLTTATVVSLVVVVIGPFCTWHSLKAVFSFPVCLRDVSIMFLFPAGISMLGCFNSCCLLELVIHSAVVIVFPGAHAFSTRLSFSLVDQVSV